MRKIKYKGISIDLETKVSPNVGLSRPSIGMEKSIGEYYFIDIDNLIPFEGQARKVFSVTEIEELGESIKLYGIRQPLTVRKSENHKGRYEIVSGERRFKGAIYAKLTKIPCIILKDQDKAKEIALVENLHREDLHPIEFGEACLDMLESNYIHSQSDISKKLSVSEGKISECIKLSKLPQEIKDYILHNNIKSRDKLRLALKNIDNIGELKKSIGMTPTTRNNFSVIRITSTQDGFLLQSNGLKKLNKEQKETLKTKLFAVIERL